MNELYFNSTALVAPEGSYTILNGICRLNIFDISSVPHFADWVPVSDALDIFSHVSYLLYAGN